MIDIIVLNLILMSSFSIIFKETLLGKVGLILLFSYSLYLLFKNKFVLEIKRDFPIFMLVLIFLFKIVLEGFSSTEFGYILKIFSIFIIFSCKDMKKMISKLDSILYFFSCCSLVGFVLINTNFINFLTKYTYSVGGYRTLFLIFGYSTKRVEQNAGFTWEPSIFASIVGIFLFYNLTKNKITRNIYIKIIIYTLTLLTTKTTAGIMILIISYFYLIFFKIKSRFLGILLLLLLQFNPLVMEKVVKKISLRKEIKGNYSSQAREIHKIIDLEIAKKIFLLGVVKQDNLRFEIAKKLKTQNKIIRKFFEIKMEYNITSNSLTGILAKYGVILFILNYYLYFRFLLKKNCIEKIFFSAILFVTFSTQYIVFYPFYMIFWYLPFDFFTIKKIKRREV